MPRRRNTPPTPPTPTDDADDAPELDDDAPELQDTPPTPRRACGPFGTCDASVVSFELYRCHSTNGRGRHELLTLPDGAGGVDRREWPIAELRPEILEPFGPGIYVARFYARKADGARVAAGMSQKVIRSTPSSAANATPAEDRRPQPSPALDLAGIVAQAEARAEARARTMLDFVLATNAAKEKQQSDFFAAMMELQTRAHTQQMEALQRARAPVQQTASMTPELARIQTELAIMRDRQRRGAPERDDDDDDDPAMKWLQSPVIGELVRVFASKMIGESPTTPNPAAAVETDAAHEDADSDESPQETP